MRDARVTSLPAGTPSWRRAAWILLAVLLAIAAAWWLYQRAQTRTGAGRPGAGVPMPVATAPVTKGDIDIDFNALGTVTPLATVTVQSQISGQLMQVLFTEGQRVKKGDLLELINSRPYEAALEQAEGTLSKDQALLKQAQTDLARYQTLQKQDSIAVQTVEDQAWLVKQEEGQIKTDQGVVNTDELNIAYCHIISPVDGRVGLRQVDEGNYVTPNEPNGLVVINEVQPITALFSLPEDDLPAITRQLNAGATLQVTAFDRANTTKLATGKLLTVNNTIDTTTGTVKLRAQFDNADDSLFPNQFVNVVLLVNTDHDATVIPTAALQRGAPGTFVYVVKPDNTVAVTPIKIGPAQGERLEVKSGLALGDQVVVDGADKLRDNAKVTIRDTAPKTAEAGTAATLQPGSQPAGNAQ